jgi:hypothetical protein
MKNSKLLTVGLLIFLLTLLVISKTFSQNGNPVRTIKADQKSEIPTHSTN